MGADETDSADINKRLGDQQVKNEPSVDVLALIEAIKNERTTYSKEQKSPERWKNGREWATLIFVVITTIGVFIQACILHNSDVTFEKTLIASNRAWLAPEAVRINPESRFVVGNLFRYIVDYRNSGRDPATDVGMFETAAGSNKQHGVGLIDRQDGKTWPEIFKGVQNKTCDGRFPDKSALVVYPSDKSRAYYLNTDFKIPETVSKKTQILYVEGCFAYTTYKAVRYEGYCFFLVPENKPVSEWKFLHCPAGNFSHDAASTELKKKANAKS